jgi:hypothetical protein
MEITIIETKQVYKKPIIEWERRIIFFPQKNPYFGSPISLEYKKQDNNDPQWTLEYEKQDTNKP